MTRLEVAATPPEYQGGCLPRASLLEKGQQPERARSRSHTARTSPGWGHSPRNGTASVLTASQLPRWSERAPQSCPHTAGPPAPVRRAQTWGLGLASEAFHKLAPACRPGPLPRAEGHTSPPPAARPDPWPLVGRTAFLPFFLPTCPSEPRAKPTPSKGLSLPLLPLAAVPFSLTCLLHPPNTGSTPSSNPELRPLKTSTASVSPSCFPSIQTEVRVYKRAWLEAKGFFN